MKKKKYASGGPIQKLGDISFDSSKARTGKYGNLIVTDIDTGKDYGVIRNKDGSYDFYIGNSNQKAKGNGFNNNPNASTGASKYSPKTGVGYLPRINTQGKLIDEEGNVLPSGQGILDNQSSMLSYQRLMQVNKDKHAAWGNYPGVVGRKVNPDYITNKEKDKSTLYTNISNAKVVKDLGNGYKLGETDKYKYLINTDGKGRKLTDGEYETLNYGDLRTQDRYRVSSNTGVVVPNRTYASGGSVYQPIGLPVDPSVIRDQKKEQGDFTKVMDTLTGLAGTILPMVLPGGSAVSAVAKKYKGDYTEYGNANYTAPTMPMPPGSPTNPPGTMNYSQYAALGGPLGGPVSDSTIVAPLITPPANVTYAPPQPNLLAPQVTSYNTLNTTYQSNPYRTAQQLNPMGRTMSNKSKSMDRYREHATGGDIQLSSDAFQVQGNPSVQDGNYYPEYDANLDHNEVVTEAGNQPFVYSDLLKTSSGKSYAAVAAKYEKMKGKAEKILSKSPYDEQAKSTMSQAQTLLDGLAAKQEVQAAREGHRNPDGSTKQPGQYASGGAVDNGDPIKYVFLGGESKETGIYFDPVNKYFVDRNADGTYSRIVDAQITSTLRKSYIKGDSLRLPGGEMINLDNFNKQYNSSYIQQRNAAPAVPDLLNPNSTTPSVVSNTNYPTLPGGAVDPLVQTGAPTPAPTPTAPTSQRTTAQTTQVPSDFTPDAKSFQEWYNSKVTDSKQKIPVTGKMDKTTTKLWEAQKGAYGRDVGMLFDPTTGKPSSYAVTSEGSGFSVPGPDNYVSASAGFNTLTGEPILTSETLNYPNNSEIQRLPYKYKGQPYTIKETVPGTTDPLTGQYRMGEIAAVMPDGSTPPSITQNPPALSEGYKTFAADASKKASASYNPYSYQTPWTLGDNFKFVELAGKFAGLAGGPEVQKARTDNTQITPSYYDPSNALQNVDRAFSNYSNTLAAPSINMRRAALGSAYATNLQQKSNIQGQYDQMNQQARVDYQNRLGNQNRFNAQMLSQVDNANAANRGAYDQAVQNAFTSVGQFGEDLNRKRYAQDQINLYRTQAPDVFESYMKTLVASQMFNLAKNGGQ